MAKVIYCKDFGSDCEFVSRGETEEQVLKVGAEHGKAVHGMTEVSPDMMEHARSLIRDE